MLKCREGTKRSKREVEAWWIGRWSSGKARGSPKRKPRRGGLDVEVSRRNEEVQKGGRSVADWMLKWWKGTRKSKKEAVAWWIGR